MDIIKESPKNESKKDHPSELGSEDAPKSPGSKTRKDQKECGYAQGVGGVRIHYRLAGQGSPLMLFHGNGQDSQVFQRQIKDLSKHFRVIAVDSRGHGRSQMGKEPFSFSLFAGDAVCVLDHLNIPKTAVLGYSDGGNVALEMAVRYPDRVNALILVSANMNPKGLILPVRLWYTACYGFWTMLEKVGCRVHRQQQLSGLVAKYPELTAEMLSALPIPVLVMAGQFDIIRPSHTREINSAFPNGQLCILPKEQHRVLFQNWEQCDRIILDFLTKTGS